MYSSLVPNTPHLPLLTTHLKMILENVNNNVGELVGRDRGGDDGVTAGWRMCGCGADVSVVVLVVVAAAMECGRKK
ncbi:hypothetical protein Tco_1443060, partial [Tanacetum coccineum]